MVLIVLPIELKPGPDADRLFAEVKDAIRAGADTYGRRDPLGCELEALADSARLIDPEAMRKHIDDTHDHDADDEPECSVCAESIGYNAALKDVAGGGG